MLTTVRDTCRDGQPCPALHRADSGAWIVQGYRTAQPGIVRVPVSMVPEWDNPKLRTGDDELLITGRPVTDPKMLAELDLPAEEAAVIVQAANVPAVAGASC